MNRYCERIFEAGSLTREQFIEFLAQDLTAAKAIYDALERTRSRKNWREAKQATSQRLKEFYSGRYKRQSTIDRYVAEEMSAWIEKNEWRYKFRGLKAVKWSIEPWNNGGCYYIYIDKSMLDYIGQMYDKSVNNKYFKACTGWCIVLDNWDCYVRLTLSDEMQNEWKEDTRKLSEAINHFYRGSNYWGE